MNQRIFPKELKLSLHDASGGYCQCTPECLEKADQGHHIVPNTKTNQKLYPLYLQSPFNYCSINHGCHLNKPLPRQPNEAHLRVYESYLQSLTERKAENDKNEHEN